MPDKGSCIAQWVVVHESNTGKDAFWFEHSAQLYSQADAELVYKSVTALGVLDRCV